MAEQSLLLAWDGSTDKTVRGYIVHYGSASGEYTAAVDVSTNTSTLVPGLIEGNTYFFVVTAYNTQGTESVPSNEVTFIVPGAAQMVRRARSTTPAHIRFPTVAGQTFQVQASTDFKNWYPIWQVIGTTNAWVEYADPASAILPRCFYRVQTLP